MGSGCPGVPVKLMAWTIGTAMQPMMRIRSTQYTRLPVSMGGDLGTHRCSLSISDIVRAVCYGNPTQIGHMSAIEN